MNVMTAAALASLTVNFAIDGDFHMDLDKREITCLRTGATFRFIVRAGRIEIARRGCTRGFLTGVGASLVSNLRAYVDGLRVRGIVTDFERSAADAITAFEAAGYNVRGKWAIIVGGPDYEIQAGFIDCMGAGGARKVAAAWRKNGRGKWGHATIN